MASRRIISSEKTILDKDDSNDFSPTAGEKSNIAPAVPAFVVPQLPHFLDFRTNWFIRGWLGHVIFKLLGFTFAMMAGPIGSYFLTLNTIFGGNSTYAGAFAAIMANVVLVGYVLVAMNEDQSEQIQSKEKAKKNL